MSLHGEIKGATYTAQGNWDINLLLGVEVVRVFYGGTLVGVVKYQAAWTQEQLTRIVDMLAAASGVFAPDRQVTILP